MINFSNRIKVIVFVFLIGSMVMGCSQKEKDTTGEEDVVYIDMDAKYPKKEIYIKEIIPLEMNDTSVIGRSRKVIEHEGNYFVLDYRQRDIKVFDDQGKFRYKIGNIGQGDHEYISLQDMNINPFSHSLDILDPRGKLLSFDLKTHQYHPDKIIPAGVPQISHFYRMDPELMVMNSFFQEYLLRFYNQSENAIFKVLLESEMIPTPAGGFFDYYPFWGFDDEINYLDENSSSIYQIKDLEIEKRLQFDFGRHHFDYPEIKDKDIEDLEVYTNVNEKAFPIMSCFENDQYLGIGIYFKSAIHYYLQDKNEDEIYVLPVGIYDQNFMDCFAFAMGLNTDEFRALVHTPVMFDEIFPDADIPDEWRSMIETASDIDNPWIVHYEVR